MKVKYISNLKEFFRVVNKCKGKIIVETEHGDRLNIKSKLSQYASIMNIFRNEDIHEFKILADNIDDKVTLFNYLKTA